MGSSVAEALLRQPVQPISGIDRFDGAGLYAIYYKGLFEPYLFFAEQNSNHQWKIPIYVGKAVPPGARKGGVGLGTAPGPVLYGRIREHAQSISAAENLKDGDFFVRFLVVEDIWIPLGEALLIARFSPLWNQMIDGFGNHDPGSGRYGQLRSRWDVLHPGRSWALRCKEREETFEEIVREVATYLRTAPN